MTKRTAYEDMVAALEPFAAYANQVSETTPDDAPYPYHPPMLVLRRARVALARAKKVPVEVGMFGTGAPEDVIYQRIFMSGKTRAEDVEIVKSATKGHPPNHTCWACACLRELESREAL